MVRLGRPRDSSDGENVPHPEQASSAEAPAAAAAAAEPSPTRVTDAELEDGIYEYCCFRPAGTIFSQDDLFASSIIPNNDLPTLLTVTQRLTARKRFRLMESGSKKVHWRCRQIHVARLLCELDGDCNLVYEYIETAGRDGTWTQNIMKRSKLHKGIMDKSLKTLEQKRLIKPVTDHRFPSRRTFMVIGLQPLETITGGPFYNDGDLDDEFVHHLMSYIERWVISRSWAFPRTGDGKSHTKKRKRMSEILDGPPDLGSSTTLASHLDIEDQIQQVLPLPGDYARFPSIGQITNALNDSRIAKTTLRIADVQTLVDVLVWDDKFEVIEHPDPDGGTIVTYRSVHKLVPEDGKDDIHTVTALTEAPCGRCPVFDFCEEGGLVNPTSCHYFQNWLNG